MGRGLGPRLGGIHRVAASRDDVLVERVLDIGRSIGLAPQTLRIALVFGEEQIRGAVTIEPVLAKLWVHGPNGAGSRFEQRRLVLAIAPRPRVAEPQCRQDTQPGRFRPAIVHGDLDEHVLRPRLGVFDEHVEVAVVVEYAGVEQLVLELFPRAPPVRFDQVPVGVLALRVLVEILHVGVGRRAVEVEVVLLDILAVVRLAVGESEQALLQDRVALVPQRQREA